MTPPRATTAEHNNYGAVEQLRSLTPHNLDTTSIQQWPVSVYPVLFFHFTTTFHLVFQQYRVPSFMLDSFFRLPYPQHWSHYRRLFQSPTQIAVKGFAASRIFEPRV